jgi:hypothetical protein
MTDPQNLAKQLEILKRELKLRDGALRRLLTPYSPEGREFSKTTFSGAVYGRLSPSGDAFGELADAVIKLAAEKNIDLAKLVPVQERPVRDQGILTRLKGAWLMVQYRTIRETQKDEPAAADLRYAVLIFGARTKGSGITFQILGGSSNWSGDVRSNAQDRLLYFSAYEIDRGVEERLDLITHHPVLEGVAAFQSGIVLGVARGVYNGSAVPIYASKVTLSRIELQREKELVAPIEDPAEISRLREYCCYLPEGQIQTALDAVETDSLKIERQKATRQFLTDSMRNLPGRIFIEH